MVIFNVLHDIREISRNFFGGKVIIISPQNALLLMWKIANS